MIVEGCPASQGLEKATGYEKGFSRQQTCGMKKGMFLRGTQEEQPPGCAYLKRRSRFIMVLGMGGGCKDAGGGGGGGGGERGEEKGGPLPHG